MLVASNGITSVQRRTHLEIPQRKEGADLIEHLRLIVRQHQVCFEIWPTWSMSGKVRIQKGFELLLCGVNDHGIREVGNFHALRSCENCAKTYDELRELADWVLLLETPLAHQIYSFDHALHLGPPNRQHRSEIVLTTTVLFQCEQRNFRFGLDCLKDVRGRLAKLGIHEDLWIVEDMRECLN